MAILMLAGGMSLDLRLARHQTIPPMDTMITMVMSTHRNPTELTESELLAEIEALQQQNDWEAASEPITLMRLIHPGYVWRPHLAVISNALTDVRDAYDNHKSGKGPRLLIQEPPQTGKTVTGVVGAAFWWLIHHPNHRVVIGSYGDTLAIDRGVDIKKMVDEHGHRFGLKVSRGTASKQHWRLTTGGGVRSVGVGAGITGHPADIVFIDDPHKSRQEADSLRSRERVWSWFSADIVSRLSPGAPVVVVMTPWDPDDLSARLVSAQKRVEDGGRWKVIRMPALCDDPANDPLGRKYGEPLTHPKIETSDVQGLMEHWQEKRATSTMQDWASLYMCDPRPAEGALVTADLLRERRCFETSSKCYPCDPNPRRSAVAVDPSGGGRDTAGIIGGYLGSDNRLYLTHDYSGVMPSDQWARRACWLAAEIDADRIIVEKNFGGDMGQLTIRTAWASLVREVTGSDAALFRRMCPMITSVSARQNKRLRAEPIAQQWVEDKIRTSKYLPELEQEWATWQPDSTNSPGRIDASVYLAYALIRTPNPGNGSIRQHRPGNLPTSGLGPLG